MPQLLVSDAIAADLTAEAENAAREQIVDEVLADAQKWNEELKRIDYDLSLVLVGDDEHARRYGLVPGCWHLKKRIPGGTDEYMPLVGPNGEYREPGGWIFEALNASDMWNPRVHRSRQEAKRKLREARRRAKELEREQRQDEMKLAARAAKRMRGDSGLHKRTDKRPVRGIILPPGVKA